MKLLMLLLHKLPCFFILFVCVLFFPFHTRAHFVICLWALKFAGKYVRILLLLLLLLLSSFLFYLLSFSVLCFLSPVFSCNLSLYLYVVMSLCD
jgi:hypothetical protein